MSFFENILKRDPSVFDTPPTELNAFIAWALEHHLSLPPDAPAVVRDYARQKLEALHNKWVIRDGMIATLLAEPPAPVEELPAYKRDLTGMVFGKLNAVKRHRGQMWVCSCACGEQTLAQASQLLRGRRTSCGCASKPKDDISPEQLRALLAYDPDTGTITWIKSGHFNSRVHPGDRAGAVGSEGYVRIMIDGRKYQAHRLAFCLAINKWPDGQIDHINGDRIDNRLCNLREASHAQSAANRTARNNKLGVKGVWRRPNRRRPFQAQFRGRLLGYFASEKEASEAYNAAAEAFFGEFAYHRRPKGPLH
jgi:hypothetical protein